MSRRIGADEFARLTRSRSSCSADSETDFVPRFLQTSAPVPPILQTQLAALPAPAFAPGQRWQSRQRGHAAAGAPVQQSGASSTAMPPPPPPPADQPTTPPTSSRASSRSPPPRRVTRPPAPRLRGWAATPESERRYILVDTVLGDMLRQMGASQVRNLFINALSRHERAETGIIGQTILTCDDSRTRIYWNLEVMGGRPRGRVADLSCTDTDGYINV